MIQFCSTFFLFGLVGIVYSTAIVKYATLETLLADKTFEMRVSSESNNGAALEGKTTSFKDRCRPAAPKSRFVTQRKICQPYPVMNFDRCRIPTKIYMTRCCTSQVTDKSLECREVFYSIQVLKSKNCNRNNLEDYEKTNITVPISCVCVLPRALPEPAP